MIRRFFDMPLLLVTGLVSGFVGAGIIVALWGNYLTDQQVRQIFCGCSLIPVFIGGVWDYADAKRISKFHSEGER